MTLTPVAEHLAVEPSLPVFTTSDCPALWSNPDLPHARRTLYHYVTAAVLNNTVHTKNMKCKNWTFIQIEARLGTFFSSERIFSRNFQNLQFSSIKLAGAVCVQHILISRCLSFLLRKEHLIQDWNSILKQFLCF